jgi:hypothetical protein
MTRDPAWLLQYKKDVYSQSGEDGIVQAILNAIGERDHWCVEFGAWDGRRFSNSRNLIESYFYNAVLIEGDAERFAALKKFYAANHNVTPVHAFLGFGKEDGLDSILKKTAIPAGFDFLSIDIDGNDFHVWKAMEAYRPKLISIEFNPTIPNECDFVQPADAKVNQGSSLKSLVALGKARAYELASVLQFNAFFVRRDLFARLEICNNSVNELRKDLSQITYFFQGFDGHIFVQGKQRLQWHGLDFDEEDLQLLPVPLQKFARNYSPAEKKVFERYKTWLGFKRQMRKLQAVVQKVCVVMLARIESSKRS